MFGKTKDTDQHPGDPSSEFFGDEDAVEEAALVDHLRDRVEHVEQQLSSQFTSLAAYAQIAQEQIETARAEAKHTSERTERRLIELVERERADRLEALGHSPANGHPSTGWSAPGADDRLDALERSVAQIQHGLNDCLSRQKALADAITALFEPQMARPHMIGEPIAPESMCGSVDEVLPPPPASDSESEAIGELSIL